MPSMDLSGSTFDDVAAAAPAADASADDPVDIAPIDSRRSVKKVSKMPKWLKIVLGTVIPSVCVGAILLWGGLTKWKFVNTANAETGGPTNGQHQDAVQATDFSAENLKTVEDKIKGIDERVGTVTKFSGYEFTVTDEDAGTGTLLVKFAGKDKDGKDVEYRITIEGVTEPKSAAEIMDAINNATELTLGIYGEQNNNTNPDPTPSIVERLDITEEQIQQVEVQNAIKGKNIGTVTKLISSNYEAGIAAQDEGGVTSGVLTLYFGGTDGANREVVYKTALDVRSDASSEDVLAQIRTEKPGSEVYTQTTSIAQGVAQKSVFFYGERDAEYTEFDTSLANVSICATAKYDPDRNETRCKSVKVVAFIDGAFVESDFPAAEGLTFSGELSQEELDQAVLARYYEFYNSNQGEAE